MKKTFSTLFAALLVFAVVGQASAYFEAGTLTQVAYVADDTEAATDLGIDLATYDFANASNDTVANGTLSLTQFPTTNNWGDVQVGIWGVSDGYGYFATTSETAPTIGERKFASFNGAASTANGNYAVYGENPVTAPTSVSTSYSTLFNSNQTTPGQYAGLNLDNAVGEANLADLATQGYIDMYLYKVDGTGRSAVLASEDYLAVIRVTAAGDTIVNPNAVPVPAAVLLFGSGLLGLIGFRKRNA